MTDGELLLQLQGGDMSPLAEIHARHVGLMRREARAMGVRAHDLDDICQEILLAVARRVESWRPHIGAISYLRIIARNVSSNWVRAESRRAEMVSQLTAENEPVSKSSESEGVEGLEGLLANLPDVQYRAVELVYLESKTHAEAAAEMGCSVEASWLRVHRAITSLRSQVKGNEAAR